MFKSFHSLTSFAKFGIKGFLICTCILAIIADKDYINLFLGPRRTPFLNN